MNREVGYYSTEVKQKLQLGYDAFHQENFELAIQYFGDVLKDNPGLAQALLGLSVSCFFMGDYQNACRYMGYCIEKRPSGVVTEMAENFMDLCVGHCDIPNMAAATNNIQHL